MGSVRSVSGTERLSLKNWQFHPTQPGFVKQLEDLCQVSRWYPAVVPGTIAKSAREFNLIHEVPEVMAPDEHDWWFKCQFEARAQKQADLRLNFDGLATIADVWLNGRVLFSSQNMFISRTVDVTEFLRQGTNRLVICFRALAPRLRETRGRPRWRTRLVNHQQLRWFRTTLLGRIPAWPEPPPAVGPWRPITLEIANLIKVHRACIVPRVEGNRGYVGAQFSISAVTGGKIANATLRVGPYSSTLQIDEETIQGEMEMGPVERWLPHTHGSQPLYPVSLEVALHNGKVSLVDLGFTGFRDVSFEGDPEDFAIAINGLGIFFRGACWIPLDSDGLVTDSITYQRELLRLRAAGGNMVRIAGPTIYESDEFYDLADELGISVWQDFMFANMDYPTESPDFLREVREEATQVLDRLASHPSVTVLCGNSEVEQQVSFLGLAPDKSQNEWFDRELAELCSKRMPMAIYWPSSPSGGPVPVYPEAGDCHYQGVGAYRRGLEDAKVSGVRFASECLAFANVPEPRSIASVFGTCDPSVQSPRWKEGSPRDRDRGWDFDDIREEYLRRLFAVDPLSIRYSDKERYLALSRATTGEVMFRVFATWRTDRSCRGGLVWFWRDLAPGAGFGIVDSSGTPKSAYYYLARAWQPLTLFLIDAGLNGLRVVIQNDHPKRYAASLKLSLFVPGNPIPLHILEPLTIPAHSRINLSVDTLAGGFRDFSYAYKFGPAVYEVIAGELLDEESVLAEDFYFPHGVPNYRRDDVKLEATTLMEGDDVVVMLDTNVVAYCVWVEIPGYLPNDNYFHMVPGRTKTIRFVGEYNPREYYGSARALNSSTTTTFPLVPGG